MSRRQADFPQSGLGRRGLSEDLRHPLMFRCGPRWSCILLLRGSGTNRAARQANRLILQPRQKPGSLKLSSLKAISLKAISHKASSLKECLIYQNQCFGR